MSLLKLNYVHGLSSCHANLTINSCYYQLLAFSLANYRKYHAKGSSSPITPNTDTAIVHLPIQSGTNKSKFIRLDSVIIVLKVSASPKQLHTSIYLYIQSVVWKIIAQLLQESEKGQATPLIDSSRRITPENLVLDQRDQSWWK